LGPLLRGYIVVQLLTMVAWPLTYRIFRALPDRGYAFAKGLALLEIGLLSWWGSAFFEIPATPLTLWLMLGILAGVTAFWYRRSRVAADRTSPKPFSWLSRNLLTVVSVETVFLTGFFGWALFRALNPAIAHTEQPMDFAFLTAIQSRPSVPPADPWLAGYPIGYYYLGYWILACFGSLAHTLPEVTYNLGQALWYGLLLTGCFGIGYNLALSPSGGRRGQIYAILAGKLTAIAVAISANLEGCLEWFYAQGMLSDRLAAFWQVCDFPARARITGNWFIGGDWWWWRSSRVVQDRGIYGEHIEIITEFPFFSYFLGDNHPHLLNLPFLALLTALLLNRVLAGRPTDVSGLSGPTDRRPTGVFRRWIPAFVILGAIAFVNLWDLAGAGILTLLAFLAVNAKEFGPLPEALGLQSRPGATNPGEEARPRAARRSEFVRMPHVLKPLVPLFLALLLIALLFWPFLLTLQGSVTGIAVTFLNPTLFRQVFLVFGPFLPAVLLLLFIRSRRLGLRPRQVLPWFLGLWAAPVAGLSAAVLLLLDSSERTLALSRWATSPFTSLIFASLAGWALALACKAFDIKSETDHSGDRAADFAVMLVAAGALMILLPEFVYVGDAFQTRMNTVFKFYYQAWFFLGCAAAFAVFHALKARRRWKRMAGVCALLGLFPGLIYPSAVIGGHLTLPEGGLSLDGIRFQLSGDETSAIDWIRQNLPVGSRILEGVGESYRADQNRFSAATGRPTLLGWAAHELQWRGRLYQEFTAGRGEAADLVYRSGKAEEIARTLREWQIDLVVVGPAERDLYQISSEREATFSRAMEEVFNSGTISLYRPRVWPGEPGFEERP